MMNDSKDVYYTNEKHFDVLSILELCKRDKVESPSELSTSMSQIDQLTHCYAIKAEILLIQDLLKLKTLESYHIHTISTYVCEPGFHQWKHLQRQRESSVEIENPTVNSFEEAKDVIEAIILSVDNCDHGIKFLQLLLESEHCNGLIVSIRTAWSGYISKSYETESSLLEHYADTRRLG